jgi:hypothetical protein
LAEKQYRTVFGIVQFEPREGEAGGKPVRNITVRQTGFGDKAVRVSATLWPSHAHVEVEEGDVVVFEGAYTQNKGKDKNDNPITYHNVSVNRIAVLGKSDGGEETDTVNTASAAADPGDDEDLGF